MVNLRLDEASLVEQRLASIAQPFWNSTKPNPQFVSGAWPKFIMHIFAIGILHEKVLISLGHRMILRDLGNHMDAFCYLTSLFNLQKPLFIDFWPLRSNAM